MRGTEDFSLTLPRGFDGQTRVIGGLVLREIERILKQIVRFFEEDDGAVSGSRLFDAFRSRFYLR